MLIGKIRACGACGAQSEVLGKPAPTKKSHRIVHEAQVLLPLFISHEHATVRRAQNYAAVRSESMATSLGAQLAQIRNENTNPLDLKAQKKAHSQSLIFEPQIAGAQDFDTIYQLCYDGFNDLCHLDSRFLSFAETLFSEQGKSQDRTQMTSTQNMELDIVLEDFIYLISSHLSLKPALKAIEWIIRRFRSATIPFAVRY